MSEKMTVLDVPAIPGGGLTDYGHIAPPEMLDRARRHYQRQLADAEWILAALESGQYTVTHQRGIHRPTNQRQVWPEGA